MFCTRAGIASTTLASRSTDAARNTNTKTDVFLFVKIRTSGAGA